MAITVQQVRSVLWDPAKEGSNYGQIRTSSSENSQGHLTFTSNGNTWTLSEQAVINP